MSEKFRGSLLAKMQLPPFLLRQAAALRRIVRRDEIDVVNAHWIIPQGLTSVWALRGLDRVKLVLQIHAGDVYLLNRLKGGRRIARYVLNRCDAVYADGG